MSKITDMAKFFSGLNKKQKERLVYHAEKGTEILCGTLATHYTSESGAG